jgi:hypothetical protein
MTVEAGELFFLQSPGATEDHGISRDSIVPGSGRIPVRGRGGHQVAPRSGRT